MKTSRAPQQHRGEFTTPHFTRERAHFAFGLFSSFWNLFFSPLHACVTPFLFSLSPSLFRLTRFFSSSAIGFSPFERSQGNNTFLSTFQPQEKQCPEHNKRPSTSFVFKPTLLAGTKPRWGQDRAKMCLCVRERDSEMGCVFVFTRMCVCFFSLCGSESVMSLSSPTARPPPGRTTWNPDVRRSLTLIGQITSHHMLSYHSSPPPPVIGILSHLSRLSSALQVTLKSPGTLWPRLDCTCALRSLPHKTHRDRHTHARGCTHSN